MIEQVTAIREDLAIAIVVDDEVKFISMRDGETNPLLTMNFESAKRFLLQIAELIHSQEGQLE